MKCMNNRIAYIREGSGCMMESVFSFVLEASGWMLEIKDAYFLEATGMRMEANTNFGYRTSRWIGRL